MAESLPPECIDCLLFSRAEQNWLVPASLVVEVVAHFADTAPDTLDWRGQSLTCHAEGRPVRALLVMRSLRGDDEVFHALALEALPRPCHVVEAQLQRDEDGVMRLDGEPVRLYEGPPGE